MRALAIAVLLSASIASADEDLVIREMCTRNTRYHGETRDLDVKNADIRDVLVLLADTGKVNIVVADDVSGKVTMRLKKVPWDQILCTVAAVHELRVTVEQKTIITVTRRPK
jgi:type IV pilus assembly protein PilQ